MKETLPEIIKRHFGLVVMSYQLQLTRLESVLELRCCVGLFDHTVLLSRGSLEPCSFTVTYDKFHRLDGPTYCLSKGIELSLFLNPGKETDEILESLKS